MLVAAFHACSSLNIDIHRASSVASGIFGLNSPLLHIASSFTNGSDNDSRAMIASWAIVGITAVLASVALWMRFQNAFFASVGLTTKNAESGSESEIKGIRLVREDASAQRFSFVTRLAWYFDCRSMYKDVWHKFNKLNLPVLVPTLGNRKEIFLPHSSMNWAMTQPARILGMWPAFDEMFQLSHSLGDNKYMMDIWPHMLARKVLTTELDDHLMDIHEEIQIAMDTHLGTDTENWKTMNMLKVIRMIIGQAGTRFIVGPDLCRNKEFLAEMIDSIDSIAANAGATGFVPERIRAFAGKIICFPTYLRLKRLSKYYEPLFTKRIQMLNDDAPDQPVDLLQKMLRFARKNRPQELATEQMTRRMCMASFAFVYLASHTTTNLISNIMDSDREHNTMDVLRAEADEFLAAHPEPKDLWSRPQTTRMVKMDSAMRESLRLHTTPTRSIVRQVMIDGVVTDTGLPVPKGALLSFVSHPMHTDGTIYDSPDSYDPFRFEKLRETEDRANDKDREHVGGDWSRHSFLSTADLLVFGRGKNACPGRLLMEIQLKMVLAYLLKNYDLKFPDSYNGRRKEPKWTFEFIFPDSTAEIQVKRRKGTTPGA